MSFNHLSMHDTQMREMQSQADGRTKSPPIVSLLIRSNGSELETREGLSSMRMKWSCMT
jgi:hypothetical protein